MNSNQLFYHPNQMEIELMLNWQIKFKQINSSIKICNIEIEKKKKKIEQTEFF